MPFRFWSEIDTPRMRDRYGSLTTYNWLLLLGQNDRKYLYFKHFRRRSLDIKAVPPLDSSFIKSDRHVRK